MTENYFIKIYYLIKTQMRIYAHSRKLVLAIMRMILTSSFLKADVTIMVIELKNGTIIEREIGALSRLVVENKDLSLVFKNSATENYSPADILKISFENVNLPSNLEDEISDKITVATTSDNSELIISNVSEANKEITIYALNGITVSKTLLNKGETRIDISSMVSGLYVVKIDGFTTKFLKR